MERIKIDREAALEQLSKLGYQSGETVFLRGFYPKNDPRIDSKLGSQKDKGRKDKGEFPDIPWEELEEWQNDGRGVYFVVNGGGHCKQDVQLCCSIFYEHDDLPKHISCNLWRTLGLPEPTVQYDTGGKSVHSYWVLNEPIAPSLWSDKKQETSIWEGIQPDLLKYADADRGLKDLPRVMRLAGCCHISVDKNTKTRSINGMTTRVGGCDQSYSYDELRSLIPIAKQNSQKLPTSNRADSPNSEFIDLRDCGNVLRDFNPDGRQNAITCRCPVHGEDGEHSNDSLHIEKDTGKFKCHAGCSNQDIYREVKKRLEVWNAPSLDFAIRKTENSKEKTDYACIGTLEDGDSSEDDFEELVDEVQELVEISRSKPPIQGLLSPQITGPLHNRAKQLNVPLETFIGILLSVAASQLPNSICIEIDAATQFRPPPILWTGIVGESGSAKSAILNTIVRPLQIIQAEADVLYEHSLEQYHEDRESWEKQSKDERDCKPVEPMPTEYYLDDFTMESIADCLSKQPERGIVAAVDELAGLLNGFDQYRPGGKGNDRQKFLSLYDGKPIKVNRKTGKRISLPQSSVSITGTIQPDVLRKHMGDISTVDGLWPRFIWISCPLSRMPPPGYGPTFNLTDLLSCLYKGLGKLTSVVFNLNGEGHRVWRKWHIWCEDQKVNEPHPALRAIYPKAKERAARIALVAHCINAVIEERVPDKIVSEDLLQAAIAFARWCIDQDRLMYADAGVTICGDSATVARFIERFQSYDDDGGWLTARKVTHWSSGRNKMKANEARAFMEQIVNLGYAIDNGKTGKSYKIKLKRSSENTGNKLLQFLNNVEFQLGNNSGNTVVTNDNSGNKNEFDSPSHLESVTSDVQDSQPFHSEGQAGLEKDMLSNVTRGGNEGKPLQGEALGVNSYLVTCGSQFKVGDRVRYIGQRYANKLEGLELVIDNIDEPYVSCEKPDGTLTTWIIQEELEQVLVSSTDDESEYVAHANNDSASSVAAD